MLKTDDGSSVVVNPNAIELMVYNDESQMLEVKLFDGSKFKKRGVPSDDFIAYYEQCEENFWKRR